MIQVNHDKAHPGKRKLKEKYEDIKIVTIDEIVFFKAILQGLRGL